MESIPSNAKLIADTVNSQIYYTESGEYQLPVVIKVLKSEYPSSKQIIQLKNELDYTAQMDISGVRKGYRKLKVGNRHALLLEYFNGHSIKEAIRLNTFDLRTFLEVAVHITNILSEIHQKNIIHKDINSNNILIDIHKKTVRIIDFGMAVNVDLKLQKLENPETLEGTLAYISPEQTGRMNRIIDYRSDLYSLGVTFYEMLTRVLPFDSPDASELVHNHLAKEPTPLHLLPNLPFPIPLVLSKIILKLLEKNAENRYQSAQGLKFDLEVCLEHLQKSDKINDFEIGKEDFSGRFQVNQKLYGREKELGILLNSFSKTCNGNNETVIVGGYSGVGKTALIHEVHRPITEKKGYFISGKYDQLQKTTPYHGLIQAFTEFIDIILTESHDKLNQWREEFNNTLKPNGKVLTDVIPSLAIVIGEQPLVETLAPSEAQNRFRFVFHKFLNTIATKEHPLVLFIDDLQWADVASINLIKEIVNDYNQTHFLFIGTYRTNEVFAHHPLSHFLATMDEENQSNHIILENLSMEHVNALIADTLKYPPEKTIALTELVYNKTHGNAFFLIQFLKSLHEENFLRFDYEKKAWRWDIGEIKKLNLPDNVIDLMSTKIQALSISTQKVLKLAACIGNRFDLSTLSIIYEKNLIETFFDLGSAVLEGLILPVEGKVLVLDEDILSSNETLIQTYEYRFVHDRIQQAVYALIEDNKRNFSHYKIAGLLLEKYQQEENSTINVLDIVNHYNQGKSYLRSEEALPLIKLNLEASYTASKSTAFESALVYINHTKQLYEEYQINNPELYHEILLNAADLMFLNGKIEESLQLLHRLAEMTESSSKKAFLYNHLALQTTMKGDYGLAIEHGIKGLQLLNVQLNLENLEQEIGNEIYQINDFIKNRTIESLLDLPLAENPEHKLIISILMNMQAAAFYTNNQLWALLNIKTVNLSIVYGNTPESASAYFGYGVVLCGVMGNYQAGYEFGKLAYDLSIQFNSHSQLCKTCSIFANFITVWVKHIKETERINLLGFQAGVDSGELQFAGYAIAHKTFNSVYQGKKLQTIYSTLDENLKFTNKTNNKAAFESISVIKLVIDYLFGNTDDVHTFSNSDFPESKLEALKQQNQSPVLIYFLTWKGICLYLCGYIKEAQSVYQEAKQHSFASIGTFLSAEYIFFESLIHLRLAQETQEKEQIFALVEANQQQMKVWADSCPANFLHKYWLVEAELAHLKGDTMAAMDLYDKAIKAAEENEFAYNEAIANELAAKFWLSLEKSDFAKLYLKRAYYLYDQWGAKRKKELLAQKYTYLLTEETAKSSLFTELTTTATTDSHSASSIVDLNSILKASQAISKEIVLETLLKNMLKIVIENAGAEKGYLIDYDTNELKVLVKGTTDSQQIENKISINKYQQTLPLSIINYVARTRKNVVIKNASDDLLYNHDSYIQKTKPKSVLCFPVIRKGELSCVIYLENNLAAGIFTGSRIAILDILSSQIAISIENALLYESLENKIRELTVANNELDLFIYRASHDLKGPIASLQGLSAIAQQDVKEEVAKGYFDMLRRTAQNMDKTLEKLLVINLINQNEEKSQVNFAQIQKDITEKLQSAATVNSVHLHFDVEETLSFYSYARFLRIIVENLVENSIMFRMLQNNQQEQYVKTHIFSQNKNVVIEVEDNGIGIAAEQIPKIFEMFHRGSELSNGNGLGLYLVDKIVKRIGGNIEVTSNLGMGTKVVVNIPMS